MIRKPEHVVPMPETLREGRDKMVESSLPEIHRSSTTIINNITITIIIIIIIIIIVIIKELREGLWIDRATRLIIIDFTLYNANINMFCIAKVRDDPFQPLKKLSGLLEEGFLNSTDLSLSPGTGTSV